MQALNIVALIGRLTKDPEVSYTQDGKPIARWTLAVNRPKEGADFISINGFGDQATFAEKYLHKGMLVSVVGKIRTGSYTNKEGIKIYTTDIVANNIDFMEKKGEATQSNDFVNDGFMDIPDGEMPFN